MVYGCSLYRVINGRRYYIKEVEDEKQPDCQGIAPRLSHPPGRRYFSKTARTARSHAIWYVRECNCWAVGCLSDLGTNSSIISSINEDEITTCPSKVTNWSSYNDNGWKKSDDIKVECQSDGMYVTVYNTSTSNCEMSKVSASIRK